MKTGRINRNPDEASLILPLADLLWLRSEWLARGKLDKQTVLGYEQKTRQFVHWWENVGPTVDWRLTQHTLEKFETYLCELKNKYTGVQLSWHTRHNTLRRVSEMFGWAYKFEIIEGVDPRLWMPIATGEAPERTAPTIEHLWRLMDVVGATTRNGLRNQTILALFIGTGIRLSELIGLESQKIMFSADSSGTADVVGKRTAANKNGRRTIAFDAFTGRYLTAYLDKMCISDGPLFFSEHDGLPLGRNGVQKMVKKAIVDAGLVGKVQSCHDFRRAFTTILSIYDANDPIFIDMIRRQLGHKHYRQTAEYTKIDADHIRERIVSPLALGQRD